MPFLSMNLSISASQSSQLVNELTRKSSSLSATVSQSVSQSIILVSKLVSREVSKSVSKSATSQSVSQRISWSCVKVNQNTMTESFLCNKGTTRVWLKPSVVFWRLITCNLFFLSSYIVHKTTVVVSGILSGERGNWE